MPRKHTVRLTVNLTPKQKEILGQLAETAGVSMSAYTLSLIEAEANAAGMQWPQHYGRGKYPRQKKAIKRDRKKWGREMTEKHAGRVAGCVFDTEMDL